MINIKQTNKRTNERTNEYCQSRHFRNEDRSTKSFIQFYWMTSITLSAGMRVIPGLCYAFSGHIRRQGGGGEFPRQARWNYQKVVWAKTAGVSVNWTALCPITGRGFGSGVSPPRNFCKLWANLHSGPFPGKMTCRTTCSRTRGHMRLGKIFSIYIYDVYGVVLTNNNILNRIPNVHLIIIYIQSTV